MKIDSLIKFDEAVNKSEKINGGETEGGFLMDLIKKLTENFVLEINDFEIVYVYHVSILLKS